MSNLYKYFLLLIIAWSYAVAATDVIQFCPQPEDLINKNTLWATKDNKWRSYTPSNASKTTSFLGAQWAGIKIGKIICLYLTNEAVAFPLAIEQMSSEPVLEPSGAGWSSLTKNRRYCKSVNIADCPFFLKKEESVNPYEEIKYKNK